MSVEVSIVKAEGESKFKAVEPPESNSEEKPGAPKDKGINPKAVRSTEKPNPDIRNLFTNFFRKTRLSFFSSMQFYQLMELLS